MAVVEEKVFLLAMDMGLKMASLSFLDGRMKTGVEEYEPMTSNMMSERNGANEHRTCLCHCLPVI